MCLLHSCYALYLFIYERLLYLKHMQLLCMLVYALLLNRDGCVEEVIGVHKGPAFSYLSVLFTQRPVL